MAGVLSLGYTADGRTLVIGHQSGKVTLWDMPSRRVRCELAGHDALLTAVAMADHGTSVATCGIDKTIKLWDLETGRLQKTLRGHLARLNCLAFSPSGTTLMAGDGNGVVGVWDPHVEQDSQRTSIDPSLVSSMAFLPDRDGREWFVTAGGTLERALAVATGQVMQPGELLIWDAASGDLVKRLQEERRIVYSARLSPRGDRFAVASGTISPGSIQVDLWDLQANRAETLVYERIGEQAVRVDWAPDGRTLVIASGDMSKQNLPGRLQLWDAVERKPLAQLHGQTGWLYGVAVSPDGKQVAAGGAGGVVYLWDMATGALTNQLKDDLEAVTWVAFDPLGKYLAAGGGSPFAVNKPSKVAVWDAREHKLIASLSGHTTMVERLAFSPDGTLLATCRRDRSIRLWKMPSGEEVRVLTGHQAPVSCVAFVDAKRLVSGADSAGWAAEKCACGTSKTAP